MVELKLDSVEELGLPKDCFVSVRVGDMQKLSRLAPTRMYRFPKSSSGDGERRYGKIEVYQRIGASSVDVDPLHEGERNILVSCGEAGFGQLQLRVEVASTQGLDKATLGGSQNENRPQTTPGAIDSAAQAKKEKQATKVKVAKDYLAKHGLETKLASAMQAVLRERPENPSEYIASRLLDGVANEQVRPHTVPSIPAPPGQKRTSAPRPQSGKLVPAQPVVRDADQFTADYYRQHFRQMPHTQWSALWSNFSARALPPKPDQLPVVPFKGYYRASFCAMSAHAWAKLHSKFPARAAPKASSLESKGQLAPEVVGGPTIDERSTLEDYARAASSVQVQDLKAAVAGVTPSGMQKLVAAIGSVSVQKSLTDRLVTSWVCASVRDSSQNALIEALQGVAPAQRHKLTDALSKGRRQLAPEVAGAPTLDELRLIAKGALLKALCNDPDFVGCTLGRRRNANLRPSVGTWQLPLPVRDSAARRIEHFTKPSVGTWLQQKPRSSRTPRLSCDAFRGRVLISLLDGLETGALELAMSTIVKKPAAPRPASSAAAARVGEVGTLEKYARAASTVQVQDLKAAVAGVSPSGMQKLLAAIESVSVKKPGGSAAAITDRLVTSWVCASVRASSQSALIVALQGVAPAQRQKLTDALISFDRKTISATSRFVNTWIAVGVANASESDVKEAVGGISASAKAKLETALRQLPASRSANAGPVANFLCTWISASVRKASESDLKAALAGVSGQSQLKLRQALTSL